MKWNHKRTVAFSPIHLGLLYCGGTISTTDCFVSLKKNSTLKFELQKQQVKKNKLIYSLHGFNGKLDITIVLNTEILMTQALAGLVTHVINWLRYRED